MVRSWDHGQPSAHTGDALDGPDPPSMPAEMPKPMHRSTIMDIDEPSAEHSRPTQLYKYYACYTIFFAMLDNSDLFGDIQIFLDMEKAFDPINRDIIFRLFIILQLPKNILCILYS